MVASFAGAGALAGIVMIVLATQAAGAVRSASASGTLSFAPNQGFAWTARGTDGGTYDTFHLTGRLYDYSPLVWGTDGQVFMMRAPWIGVMLGGAPPTRTGSDWGWIRDANGPQYTQHVVRVTSDGIVFGMGMLTILDHAFLYVR
jgi:hypothetical protein